MLASYNLQSTFSGYSFYDPETTPWIIGAILALLVGYCVMGGGKRIVKVTSTPVPFMGGLYVLVSLIVIVMNIGLLPQVLGRIFSEAFDFQAIFGGLAYSCLMYGIKRGLYSNEAGVASPNAGCLRQCQPPGEAGPGPDALCVHRHPAHLHCHRLYAAVLRRGARRGAGGALPMSRRP